MIPGDGDPAARKPTVMYQFFKKPMANRLTILKRSAVPEQIKVTTMVSEIIRRWKRISETCLEIPSKK